MTLDTNLQFGEPLFLLPFLVAQRMRPVGPSAHPLSAHHLCSFNFTILFRLQHQRWSLAPSLISQSTQKGWRNVPLVAGSRFFQSDFPRQSGALWQSSRAPSSGHERIIITTAADIKVSAVSSHDSTVGARNKRNCRRGHFLGIML